MYFPDESSGERRRPGALGARRDERARRCVARAGGRRPCGSTSACRATGRRCSSRIDDVRADLRPRRAPRGRLGRGLARGDARRRAGARERRGARRRDPGRGRGGDRRAPAAPTLYDLGRLRGRAGRRATPSSRSSARSRERVGGDAARYVHCGATSQDILDTAAMLVARDRLGLVARRARRASPRRARGSPTTHRATPMAARTLLQQAVPTTFGLKAAGWLVALLDARRGLAARRDCLAPARRRGGDARRARDAGLEVLRALRARSSGSPSRPLPWHVEPRRVAELGARARRGRRRRARRSRSTSSCSRRRRSARCAEAAGGGSSTMPHKRNPVARDARARVRPPRARARSALLDGRRQRARARRGRLAGRVAALSDACARALAGRRSAAGDSARRTRLDGGSSAPTLDRHAPRTHDRRALLRRGADRASSSAALDRATSVDATYLGSAERLRRPRARALRGRTAA